MTRCIPSSTAVAAVRHRPLRQSPAPAAHVALVVSGRHVSASQHSLSPALHWAPAASSHRAWLELGLGLGLGVGIGLGLG